MIPDNYLRHLRTQLKGFTVQEQTALIEEIGSHFDSGENDPVLGQEPEQRKKKLLSEMGSPKQMGERFRDIHRPGRLVDYLLILVPTLVVFYISTSIMNNLFTSSYVRQGLLTPEEIYIRLALCYSAFCVLMVIISYVRRSLYLKLYWVVIFGLWLAQLPGLIFYNQIQNNQRSGYCLSLQPGVPTLTFSFAWLAPWAKWIVPSIIIFMLVLVVLRMIWHIRHDLLTVIYASLLAICGTWVFYQPIVDTSVSALFQHYYHTNPYAINSIASTRGLLFVPWSLFISLGVFFLINKREFRWLALAFFFSVMGISDLLWIKVSVFWIYVLLTEVVFPLAVTVVGWFIEKQRKMKWQPAL